MCKIETYDPPSCLASSINRCSSPYVRDDWFITEGQYITPTLTFQKCVLLLPASASRNFLHSHPKCFAPPPVLFKKNQISLLKTLEDFRPPPHQMFRNFWNPFYKWNFSKSLKCFIFFSHFIPSFHRFSTKCAKRVIGVG